jgi:hypothetical protein
LRKHHVLTYALGLLLATGCTANGAALAPKGASQSPPVITNVHKLDIEQGAQVAKTVQTALYGNQQEMTLALIRLPLKEDDEGSGYVGIWDKAGKLVEKHVVEGYSLQHPVQLLAEDVTGDGIADILLETDEQANGGMGAHRLQVWVGESGQYRELELQDPVAVALQAQFQPATGSFQLTSAADGRSWTAQVPAEQLAAQEAELETGSHGVNIDPLFEAAVEDGTLVTRRWLWVGRLQLNGVGVLVTEYRYRDGALVVSDYQLEAAKGYPALTETSTP